MALINPGLAEQLADIVAATHERELAASDNTLEGHASRDTVCGYTIALTEYLERPDGSNALDYEDGDRGTEENLYKAQVVRLVDWLIRLLDTEPVRTSQEKTDLGAILTALQTGEDTGWHPEIVKLGGKYGITVGLAQASSGTASFATAGGTVTIHAYKARTPDVALDAVNVYLVEELPATGVPTPTGRYVVMVDDAYWGRRIEPAAFAPAPFERHVTMGYRLKGQILESGTAMAGANVSLRLSLQTAEDGGAVAWDSLEFNELAWDSQLATYVAGTNVYAPIQTAADGRWQFIAPSGHGALYQRAGDLRDDTPETAAQGLARWVDTTECAYKGRTVELVEGTEAVLNILSGTLQITGEPGVHLLVGTMDNPGQLYTVPAGGTVTITGLPQAEHSIVAFKLLPWGAWDPTWGCPREIAQVTRNATASVTVQPMESYTEVDVICGRVYERPGVPAAGIDIVTVDMETAEVIETIATTDGGGFWSADIPAGGLGGEPCIHDGYWGSVPVLSMPYSDIVLGARAYAAHYETYKPEAWRCFERGHANFQFCPDSVSVRTPAGGLVGTAATEYGGWVTTATLPKYEFIEDLDELIWGGTQPRLYDLIVNDECVIADFELRAQPFEGSDTAAGNLRAAGWYPEAKFLLGGKAHGNVLKGRRESVKADLPEAARVGLEFGEHDPHVEVRALRDGSDSRSCVSDLVCPYCGGPADRDPGGPFLRGHCQQCAVAFGRADAMDCRSYFQTPTIAATDEDHYTLRLVQLWDGAGAWSRTVGCHWRPDMYEESDDFLTQSGAGQVTNAPRWVARHADGLGDGKGFGKFDGDQTPAFIAGHDLDYFEGLTEIDHTMESTQLKLVFAGGYVTPMTYVVEVDCRRTDGAIETQSVTIPAGASGPNANDPFGDAIVIVETEKLCAEHKDSPHEGVGLYVGVTDVRLADPASAPGCKFTIVNDTPLLASADGIPVSPAAATPVALQITGAWGSPHVLDDAVGQVFLLWVEEGNVLMSRRAGLPGAWSLPRRITEGGDADEPWADKDECGRMTLVCKRGGGKTQIITSPDDGANWEEIE